MIRFKHLQWAALVVMCAQPSYAGMLGETIYIDRLIPSHGFDFNSFVGQSGAYTVGISSPLPLSTGNNLYASATDTDLIVDFGPAGGGGSGQPPDHYVIFSDLYLGTGVSVTGFSIVIDTVPGVSIGDISFDAHSVSINVSGATWPGGRKLDLAVHASPEPSTLVLAALGFAGLAAWGWPRRIRSR
jgi:hypothetical protein